MILTAPRDALLRACQVVQQAVNPQVTMPVYRNAKLVPGPTPDAATLMGTDLEVGIRYDLRGLAIEQPDEVMIPLARLQDILRESRDETVRLTVDRDRMKVQTLADEYDLPTEDPSTFADVANPDGDRYHELSAADLLRLARRTAFAADRTKGRYAMRGVLLDVDGPRCSLVATDGKRIAWANAPCVTQGPEPDEKKHSHLVPSKAMKLLQTILADGDWSQPVRVFLRPNDALFRTERATVYTRLVEGRFPPYRDVIPKAVKTKVPLVVGKFLSAVRRASIMTDDEAKRISCNFAAGKLELTAEGPTKGKGVVRGELTDAGIVGPDVEIIFDPAYLTDMLRALPEDETISLEMVDGQKVVVFRAGPDYLYAAVPLV